MNDKISVVNALIRMYKAHSSTLFLIHVHVCLVGADLSVTSLKFNDVWVLVAN